jgi:hypothetical protein
VVEAISTSVLPASTLVPSNAALSDELWQLLRLLPYATRFKLYGELKVGHACLCVCPCVGGLGRGGGRALACACDLLLAAMPHCWIDGVNN